jgi:hypothetical protein
MPHRILKAAHGHHKGTIHAHAKGKTGMPPHVGKRHEDGHAKSRAHHSAKRSRSAAG